MIQQISGRERERGGGLFFSLGSLNHLGTLKSKGRVQLLKFYKRNNSHDVFRKSLPSDKNR